MELNNNNKEALVSTSYFTARSLVLRPFEGYPSALAPAGFMAHRAA